MTIALQSPMLRDAHKVQTMAQGLLALLRAAGPESKAYKAHMAEWLQDRRRVVSAEPCTPIDGLILAHAMAQSAGAIPDCIALDDEGSLCVVAAELLAASAGLIAFFEASAGCSRTDLGLYDDYVGPVRN